ncbi:MAG TPA: isocitrate lyase/phosphoenolpyruvate mutase family protein [Polyangia bacterium]|nr:isocitrate lyase/phosphoenolpyruvate mutase family protein [Polyangia bacterium]
MPAAIHAFRRLHDSGCFVMPNPWDVGSAVFLHRLGFKALASTSAGLAFSRGVPDRVGALDVSEVLAHLSALAAATPLPLNADFQAGYARDPEGVAAQVRRCVATGVAGLSIEDASGDQVAPLFERAQAIERVRAARRAIDDSGIPVVLTARCEAWLVKHPDAARVALDRLVAFADAGADCLFAPALPDADAIGAVVKAVVPRPVNVLVSAPIPGLTFMRLAELGVRRISVGSALARVAWGAFMHAARELAQTGAFDALAPAASFAELNGMFSGGAPPE